MDGDGRDDYVWISPMGELTVFINIGSPPAWGQGGVAINLNLPRKSLHLADWTGTGKCDVSAFSSTSSLSYSLFG